MKFYVCKVKLASQS